MNAWKWAALIVAGGGIASTLLAAFTGKFIAQGKQYVADRARDEYVNRQIASLDKQFEVR